MEGQDNGSEPLTETATWQEQNARPCSPPPHFRNLSAQAASRVDDVCDVFETKLLTGQRPQIEEYLGGFTEPERSAVLCELLLLEWEPMKASGEIPDHAAYRNRFATASQVVDCAFDHLFPQQQTPSQTVDDVHSVPQFPGYQLQRELGSGGMGTVYKAIQLNLKREVAIKVLRWDRVKDVEARLLFKQEMEIVGQLKHPNIVEAYDAGHPEGVYYLAMEYVDGLDLKKLINCCGPLPVADACELIRRAAVGLHQAHRCKLVHRDIKPSNLLLGHTTAHDESVELKIADLGLVRLGGSSALRDFENQQNRVMGTLDFMAPEQFFTPGDVDIRADIYSLGCTLYTLLMGKPPYADRKYSDLLEKMTRHRRDTCPPPRQARPDVSVELETVIQTMMAKRREERFQTPEELAEALTSFCAGHDLTALLHMAQRRSDPRDTTSPPLVFPEPVSHPVAQPRPADQERPQASGGDRDPPIEGDLHPNSQRIATPPDDAETRDKPETLPKCEREDVMHGESPQELGAKASKGRRKWIALLVMLITLSVAAFLAKKSFFDPSQNPAETLDLLPLIDPARDGVVGQWRFEGDVLVASGEPRALLQIPSTLPAQYQLEIVIEQESHTPLIIGIIWNGAQIPIVPLSLVEVDEDPNDVDALAKKLGFVNGSERTYTCIVRKEGFTVAYESDVFTAHDQDSAPLTIDISWLPPSRDTLFLGSKNETVRISAIRLTPLASLPNGRD